MPRDGGVCSHVPGEFLITVKSVTEMRDGVKNKGSNSAAEQGASHKCASAMRASK